mmetsp:Transcript_27375/g.40967  ORF Transcript_27375/g.40967 Transcript_27375/m.40967 type:complete len:606 (-) Transcript_27375:59-1876(-)
MMKADHPIEKEIPIPANIIHRGQFTSSSPCLLGLDGIQQRAFPALQSSNVPSENSNGNNKKPKKLPRLLKSLTKLSPLSLYKAFLGRLVLISTKYNSLSKKMKTVVAMQALAFTLLVGAAGRKAVIYNAAVRSGATTAASSRLASKRPAEVSYSTFMDLCQKSQQGHTPGKNPAIKINDAIISRDKILLHLTQDEEKHTAAITSNPKLVQNDDISVQPFPSRSVYTRKVPASPDLIDLLRNENIPFRAASVRNQNAAATLARFAVFFVYMLFLLRMYKTMSNAGGGGDKSNTPGKLATTEFGDTKVTFNDIEGIDSAKFEVMELVDTLRNPGKYALLGARAPTGLLLEGPPGTGKTMLARATAATAGVPLLYCSGSDFVEMFVGRGAARVRKTFARAGKLSPCIIFIDELDALGKSRDLGLGGMVRSNDEAEQTLNQLLACMDGLDSTRGVCVLAATNRRDVLDPALVRPGRFDRIIKVELPDVGGRERILRVHAKKIPGFMECQGVDDKRLGSLGKGKAVDLSAVATVTKGLSGAELEFIVNEAAIRAVRRVSAKLRDPNIDPTTVQPNVEAIDFEASVKSYYETRRPMSGGKMGELLSNVLGK